MSKGLILGLILSIISSFTMSAGAQIFDPAALNIDPKTATGPMSPKLTGLGDNHFKVTTSSTESQYFFDQGLRLVTAFNHSEAMRSFKEAARLDPENAMAHWGWALTLGRNLNLPMMANVYGQAYDAIQRAVALKEQVSDRERDYIEALATRYTNDFDQGRDKFDIAYMHAMEELMNKYPDDLDAAVLWVSSAMNNQPWDYWNQDGTPKGNAEKIIAKLNDIITKNPDHAAAHHYLIHVAESKRPELAEASADALAPLMPNAGHLVHMPSHIFIRLGRYQDAYDTNVHAVAVDEDYIMQSKAQGIYPLMYYPHNVHFLSWSSMFTGRSGLAIEAALKAKSILEMGVRKSSWGSGENFRVQPIFVMVRFGKWQELLEMEKPFVKAQYLTGMWHYGRSMAYMNTGNMSAAKEELQKLQEIVTKFEEGIPGYSEGGALTNVLNLEIASSLVSGQMASMEGEFETAIYHLGTATRLEDSHVYTEPASWNFPTRHILGAILLEAGKPKEAEVVYWQDLAHNPNNAYSFYGLYQSLSKQGKEAEAAEYLAKYEEEWKDSDVKLTSSRF
ncbi:MAG: tetratricopeptide repeat protein [Sphingomonadales bacterium]